MQLTRPCHQFESGIDMMINEALRLIRVYWGKSQAEMARQIDLSQPYLSEIERGQKEVTLDILRRYSDSLNVPISSLLLFAERIEGMPPPSHRRVIIAGKVLNLLKRLVPDAQEEPA
jgi:transcriptional regulator with XRE-family HTH domain